MNNTNNLNTSNNSMNNSQLNNNQNNQQNHKKMEQHFFAFSINLHRMEVNVNINPNTTIEMNLKIGSQQICTQQDLRFESMSKEMDLDETLQLTVPLYVSGNNLAKSTKNITQQYQQKYAVIEIHTIQLAKNIRTMVGQVKFDVSKYVNNQEKDVYESIALEKSLYEGKLSFTIDFLPTHNENNDLYSSQVIENSNAKALNRSTNLKQNNQQITKIPMNKDKSKSPINNRRIIKNDSNKNIQLNQSIASNNSNQQQSIILNQSRTINNNNRKTYTQNDTSYKILVDLQEKNRLLEKDKLSLQENLQSANSNIQLLQHQINQNNKEMKEKDQEIKQQQLQIERYKEVQSLNQQLLQDLGIQQKSLQQIFSQYNQEYDFDKIDEIVRKVASSCQKERVQAQTILSLEEEKKNIELKLQQQIEEMDNLKYQNENYKRKQQLDDDKMYQMTLQTKSLNGYNKELVDKQIQLEIKLDEEKKENNYRKSVIDQQSQEISQNQKQIADLNTKCNNYLAEFKHHKNQIGSITNLIFESGIAELIEKVETVLTD